MLLAAVLMLVMIAQAAAHDDILIADFEGTDYGAWTVSGAAFGSAPARGALPDQMSVTGYNGKGLVNTYLGGDGPMGTLTSPTFPIERKHIQFLLAGGNFPDAVCINLKVDGKVVRTATYSGPGGSEHLEPYAWDVSDLAGKEAVIEIVDRHTGGWGHINVDDIKQTDKPLPGWIPNPTRELTAERRYLHLPIKNGAPPHRLTVSVDGKPERAFDIELAEGEPEWWAFLDVSEWKGKPLVLSLDRLREGSHALDNIQSSDQLPGASELYRESLRPQFHFSARRGWLNDPNGLVFNNGKYHLFFQHNPYGWNWGNMHWGHATSKDLVHWTEGPIAIYPDELGTAFSGSAVVDSKNTAGFKKGAQSPLVCIYTAAGGKFTQCLSYSNDGGDTWTKFDGNPVLDQIVHGNRDPKVFWHEPSERWIMALYLDKSDFALFASTDLKRWEKLSDVQLPGTIECPELFELELAGKPEEKFWIFYGANGGYLIGQFDGKQFASTSGPHPLHHGNCFYASQTYTNIPKKDGRRILIPWGQVALPGMPFNQMMGLPVVLTLHSTPAGPRVFVNPIRELERLRTSTKKIAAGALPVGKNALQDVAAELAEVVVEFEPGKAKEVVFTLRGTEVSYDVDAALVRCLDKQASLAPTDGKVRLHFYIDRASIDVFGGDGSLYMPMGKSLPTDVRSYSMTSRGGAARVRSLEFHQLKSAWPAAAAK
jgi:fructan beta-fructosidase